MRTLLFQQVILLLTCTIISIQPSWAESCPAETERIIAWEMEQEDALTLIEFVKFFEEEEGSRPLLNELKYFIKDEDFKGVKELTLHQLQNGIKEGWIEKNAKVLGGVIVGKSKQVDKKEASIASLFMFYGIILGIPAAYEHISVIQGVVKRGPWGRGLVVVVGVLSAAGITLGFESGLFGRHRSIIIIDSRGLDTGLEGIDASLGFCD